MENEKSADGVEHNHGLTGFLPVSSKELGGLAGACVCVCVVGSIHDNPGLLTSNKTP